MKKLSPVLILLSIGIGIAALYNSLSTKHKIGYVVIQEVFNEFNLKKELEKKYDGVRNARKKILDSIQIDLSILSKKIETKTATEEEKNIFERKRMEYAQKGRAFDEDNVVLTREYDSQIIKQLNQYISDYGKENGYDMIYGNTTSGSILYGDKKYNITKEVSVYLNEKYQGVK